MNTIPLTPDKTLIVIASIDELNLIAEGKKAFSVPVLITGVGALNIIEALKDVPRDTKILNFGYCGSSHFLKGARVFINKCDLYHPGVNYLEPLYKLDRHNYVDLPKATCHTVTDFWNGPGDEGCVYDMELAFICALGFNDVISIKTVSDNCNIEQYHNTIQK